MGQGALPNGASLLFMSVHVARKDAATFRLPTRLSAFAPFPGLYLYHCHILEHEDMGLMRNFRVDAT